MTVEERYKGNWRKVQDDCMLCEMEKKTEWHLETQDWVVAEKLGGGPFIVSKKHQKTISDEEWQNAERICHLAGFEDFEFQVVMNLCENHWHAHLVQEGTTTDLSDE